MFVFLLPAVAAIVLAVNASGWWAMGLAFTGLAVAVSGVLMSIARLLRREDDANGGARAR
jgi:hypothetical protein